MPRGIFTTPEDLARIKMPVGSICTRNFLRRIKDPTCTFFRRIDLADPSDHIADPL